MDIQFVFNGLKITGKDREYVSEKVSAVRKLLGGGLERAVVDIHETPQNEVCVEVTLETPAKNFRAVETGANVRAAVDLVEDQLKEQIRDFKDRRQTLERRGARSIKKKLTLDESARL